MKSLLAVTLLLLACSLSLAQKVERDQITLERTACFGPCPMYSVTVTSDGKVKFEGRQFTKVTGKASGKITKQAFRGLVAEFKKIDYFSLPDQYSPGTPQCPQMITDHPSANTSLRLNGKTKTVAHYHGCGESGKLPQLTALENKIDLVAKTQTWIK
jgi:Domain of unknown function (DUF6438)